MRILLSFIFMLAVDVLIFWSQLSTNAIAIDAGVTGPTFFNYEGSAIAQYDQGNYTTQENLTSVLPTLNTQVTPTGNVFTDTFSSIKNWLYDTTGLKFFVSFINAFPAFLRTIGLPVEIAYGIGAIWHIVSILLIILMMRGNI